jgi:transcriptional regulator with XRE-family HTH domain
MTEKQIGPTLVKLRRKILGKSQAEFANLLGISLQRIKDLETRTTGMTRGAAKLDDIAKRIRTQAGADVSKWNGKILNMRGKTYTEDDFAAWQKQFHMRDEAAARAHGRYLCAWVDLMFEAAARKGCPASVWSSLMDWIETTRRDFGLSSAIDAVLKERLAELPTEYPELPLVFANQWKPRGRRCPPKWSKVKWIEWCKERGRVGLSYMVIGPEEIHLDL